MLPVIEIFNSIQGESSAAGYRCTFIRLAGCNLNCSWCDTRYACTTDDATPMTQADILKKVATFDCSLVELTGGEPLLYDETPDLVDRLLVQGYRVLVETNGSKDISVIPDDARCIVDMKGPSSGMTDRMDLVNLDSLNEYDELKFVIATVDDFHWAVNLMAQYDLPGPHPVTFQPADPGMPLAQLAELILENRLDVRLGLQLHKIIWPDRDRGV